MLRGQVLNLRLLLRNRTLLSLDRSHLLLELVLLLLERVQEHGVDEVVAHRLRGAVCAPSAGKRVRQVEGGILGLHAIRGAGS